MVFLISSIPHRRMKAAYVKVLVYVGSVLLLPCVLGDACMCACICNLHLCYILMLGVAEFFQKKGVPCQLYAIFFSAILMLGVAKFFQIKEVLCRQLNIQNVSLVSLCSSSLAI